VLVLGGALGNLVDRFARSPGFLRGHVVDFVAVGWWPVFNVADSCVTIGAILLVVRTLFAPSAAE
jgi:signal peptidase II